MHNVHDFPGLRQAPSNLEAERALLGTLLMRNGSYDKVCDYLKADHFTDPAHYRLYEIMSDMLGKGLQANPVTLKAHAQSDPDISRAGGPAFLATLCNSAPTTINASEYGEIVRDLALRRQLITLTSQAQNLAYDTTEPAASQIEALETELFEISATRDKVDFTHIGDAAKAAIKQAEIAFKADGALTGVTTGLADLDRQLGGLHASDLIILAGRPSMGKSGAALTFAFNAAKAGKRTAFFSFEMSAPQLANRALAKVLNLDSHRIRNGRLSPTDFGNLEQARQDYESLPLMINDGPGQTVQQIRTACRRMKRKGGLDLVIIDYLQLIAPSGKGGNRVEEVSAITWGLKALAKDLNVPVVALSQLSRKVEEREDKKPQLSDLRESGSIEQDADVVLFVYREQYYIERAGGTCDPSQEGRAKIIISKQRHGPIEDLDFHFEYKSAWFSDLSNQVVETTR